MQNPSASTKTQSLQRNIQTLKEFYSLMADNRQLRVRIAQKCFNNKEISEQIIQGLVDTKESLEAIPKDDRGYVVELGQGKKMNIDLDYEIGESDKDILFLQQGESALLEKMQVLDPRFDDEVKQGVEFLKGKAFNCLITDRDGTTNNYCGRYRSSIQSVYNSLFLSRFAKNSCKNPIFITSAPLQDPGIVDVSVNPPGSFVYAAAKGRTLYDLDNKMHAFPIDDDKQKLQDKLSDHLKKLLTQPEYEKYSLIGSGYQYKFGQLTLARQDIAGSVDENESKEFLKLIEKIVAEFDPKGENLRIEDTGLDIEIILTISRAGGIADFDKGDGVRFLDKELGLDIDNGPHLVCGDTGSDVPMLQATFDLCPDTYGIFVTEKEELKEKVKNTGANVYFVSKPDALVAILNQISKI
jgi:hydroxymethylpyrimidine pyrophosphatase-like HAD family hydrolase